MAVERIYLDTNVFIYAFEKRGRLSDLLKELLIGSKNEPQRLVSSELTLSEFLVKPLEQGNFALVQVYENWIISSPYLEVVPVTREVLRDAAALRVDDKTLKLPDAIHLTTARGTDCDIFLTDDRRIKGAYGLRLVRLTEGAIEGLLKS